jgi:GAF domain-containing protein
MANNFEANSSRSHLHSDVGSGNLGNVLQRLNKSLQRDSLVQTTIADLRLFLQADRVLLYYFYSEWKGQVTFESLSNGEFSIFGSTGPDACFTEEYAALYLAGRVRAIPDIETEPIDSCHRDFLRNLRVKANLVVPIVTSGGLWGLLVAHHCRGSKVWTQTEIEQMKAGAKMIASSSLLNQH